MINKNELEEVVAVFIDWLERDREFIHATRSEFKKFILEVLIPLMESKYSLRTDADGRVFAGASNGGVFATYIGAAASDKFRYILNYSGYPYYKFGGDPGFGEVYKTDNLPIRVMTITGKYEKRGNVDGAKNFHNILNKNPYKIPNKLVFYPQGHTFRMWGDAFREGITWLLYDR
jgi:enterochelin esterase-like enzyme